MFGIGNKDENSDKLGVQVHVVASEEAFKLATKIWDENIRTVHFDERAKKEFLRFAYANPKCEVWLQHDQGRVDVLELVVRWEADKTHEVFVLTRGQQAGDQERALSVLNSMLTTPSVVLSSDKY